MNRMLMPRRCRVSWRILSAGLLMMGLTVSSAARADGEKAAVKPVGTVTFQLENDLFYGADRHYTNGVRLSWVSPPSKDTPNPLPWLRDWLQWLSLNPSDKTRLGLALGQDIYTPADRRRTDLILDDRPYAGWLYGAMSLHSETQIRGGAYLPHMLDSIELDVGIVGPHAYARDVQDYIHDIRLFDRFDGWSNQLRDEPGIMLIYERKWRGEPQPAFPGALEVDVVPRVGGSIGNVLSHMNLGGAVRYGYNIPRDFGPPNLIKGMRTMDAERTGGKLSLYAFAGAEGRYVAHNIFLDGNTWRSSHGVPRKPLVGDLSFGLAVETWGIKLAYTSVLRSREFEGQADNARFGSVNLSWQFAF